MNVAFVYGDRIVTPELTGSILEGITRDSLLQVARDLGYTAEEGVITLEQWRADAASGALTEVFACGTAAVVTPIGHVKTRTDEWTHGDGAPGEVTVRLRQALLDLQRGTAEDRHGWMHKIG